MKKISVITPCYNSVKYLAECLESLEQQTIGLEHLEIILVNDASTDSTWEQIVEFEKKYPESVIAIDLPENRRQGGARNEGLRYATGEYIAFLDSDDKALPETYEKVYNCAMQTQSDMVQFNHYNVTSGREELCDNCIAEGVMDIESETDKKLCLMAEILTMGCWNKIYRRKMVEESRAEYAEHKIYEEPAFVYPQMFYAKRICCMKEAFYKIRMNQESTMHHEVKKKGRLLDHPEVQMQVLRYMIAHREFMMPYYDEIEFYFLKTYYVETLYFAARGNLFLDIEYLRKMQSNIRQLFPEWRNNFYISKEKKMQRIVETCEREYSQQEVEKLCTMVYAIVNEC